MKCLIDTNIIIDHLRGDNCATNFLMQVERGQIKALISVITEYEILASRSISNKEMSIIKKVLKLLPSRSITSALVRKAVYFHRTYGIDVIDALIAATAWITKTTLITRNIKHFRNIREIKIKSI